VTNNEYRRLILRARDSLATMTRQVMRRVHAAYVTASESVAAAVQAAEMAGAAEITQTSLASISKQLERAAGDISAAISRNGVIGIEASAAKIGTINDTYMSEVFNRAGVTRVDTVVIGQIVSGVNTKVVESVVNRIWQDGYTFSDRVWRVGRRYRDDIRNVLSAGLAQGRDVFAIAQDIQVYTADGRVRLMNRYGELRRGTREFARRIPKAVDWRATRLVRTELYNSLRDAGIQQGIINPACTKLYDWVRQSTTDWGCDCPEFEEAGPYRLEHVPSAPHANCQCAVVPRMENLKDFENRLRAWDQGGPDAGLDQWYNEVYLPAV